jgi:hypothetical protein
LRGSAGFAFTHRFDYSLIHLTAKFAKKYTQWTQGIQNQRPNPLRSLRYHSVPCGYEFLFPYFQNCFSNFISPQKLIYHHSFFAFQLTFFEYISGIKNRKPQDDYIWRMKTKIKNEKKTELLRKYGKPEIKQPKVFEEFTGIWKDRPVSLEQIRKKAWNRK